LDFERRQHEVIEQSGEDSHQPTRVRAKVMRRFKSVRQLQCFASTRDQVAHLFMRCRRHPCV